MPVKTSQLCEEEEPMKKILVMALSVALIATMAITGTIAYLSDQDAAVNQATVGTVFVEQTEWERGADGVQPFTQYQQVVPAVPVASPAPDATSVTTPAGSVSMTNAYKNYIDKIVYAKNTGTAEAYMRTVIAVPANSENWLHLDLNEKSDSNSTGWTVATQRIKNVTIDGQPDTYDLIVLTSEAKIAGGAYAAPSLLGFYVDKDVNNVKGEDGQLSHYTYNGTNIGNISDLRILVATQAVQTEGWNSMAEAFKVALDNNADLSATNNPWTIAASSTPSATPIKVGTAAELKALMNSLIDTKTNNTVYLEANKTYDLTGIEWTPVSVNGSYVGTITLDGRGATIKGLDAPLFYGGEQGDEGDVVIKNLTIEDSTLTNNKTFPTVDSSNNIAGGYGAFVTYTEKPVTLENCHLKNVKINGNNAKTGGLVGYSTTYSADKKIIITNCSVENCEISSKGSVGGIVGHATGGSHVTTNISNCTVKNTKLTSTAKSYRVGAIVGTSGAGTVKLTGCTSTGNTITQNSSTAEGTITNPHADNDLYGRITDGYGGTLIIDGATMTETSANS